jgi:hypothetical protein
MMIPVSSFAQRWKLRRYEACFGICTSQYYGDIGGSADANNFYGLKDIEILSTRPSFAVGARYKLTGSMAVKMNMIFGIVSGNDKRSANVERNYSFNTAIFEPSFQFEYYLIPESKSTGSPASFSRRGMMNNYSKFYAYVFGGVGGIYVNPKIKRDEEVIPLEEFSKFALAFPMGVAVKYSIDSRWSVGLEFGRRFTTTDYIDGYHSKYSKANDLYDFGMFSAIYKIPTDRRGLPIIGKAGRYRR